MNALILVGLVVSAVVVGGLAVASRVRRRRADAVPSRTVGDLVRPRPAEPEPAAAGYVSRLRRVIAAGSTAGSGTLAVREVDAAAPGDAAHPPADRAPTVPAQARPAPPAPVVPPQAAPDPARAPSAPRPAAPPSAARPQAHPAAPAEPVVSLLPADVTQPIPIVVTGGPQPVRATVAGPDGSVLAGAAVSLLDRRGREVDGASSDGDGRAEVRAPHAGPFVLVANAAGHQPRAVTLLVHERAVDLEVRLARSAGLSGVVRDGAGPVAGARVALEQGREVVDAVVSDGDGGYRFGDLAAGDYRLTATGRAGTAAAVLRIPGDADLHHDVYLDD